MTFRSRVAESSVSARIWLAVRKEGALWRSPSIQAAAMRVTETINAAVASDEVMKGQFRPRRFCSSLLDQHSKCRFRVRVSPTNAVVELSREPRKDTEYAQREIHGAE